MLRSSLGVLIAVLTTSAVFARAESNPAPRVERLGEGRPVVSQASFARVGVSEDGDNINGPSLIRVPDWIPADRRADPAARYYLYFGNHKGEYIRMAWAREITGPYHLFNVGSARTGAHPGRGVLDLGPAEALQFPGGIRVRGHIASPDVHVDHDRHRLAMYLHGPTNADHVSTDFATGRQKSLVATAPYGLNFNNPDGELRGGVGGGHRGHGLRNVILGNAYFRVFRHESGLYAFSNYGRVWRAPDAEHPWRIHGSPTTDAWQERRSSNPVYDDLAQHFARHAGASERDQAGFDGGEGASGKVAGRTGGPRHFAVRARGDDFEVWYTSRGDRPERIFRTTLSTAGSWLEWRTAVTDDATVHDEMLRPELAWEGAGRPLSVSTNGPEVGVNQLRDPALFRDADGRWYLLYCGGGEEAIGLARVIDP